MIKLLYCCILAFCASEASADETSLDLTGPATLSGWIDFRVGHADGESSWLNGGYGKLRYGGTSNSLSVAAAALLWAPRLSDTVTGHILVQDEPASQNPLGVSEAYVKWKPVPTSATRYSLRLGRLFPPISLEHDGPGWTTTRTLTPSAINSWVGEELLVDAAEANIQTTAGENGFSGTFGIYRSGDTAGTILAFRGWALHDVTSADNSELTLPNSNGTGYRFVFPKQGLFSKPAVEVDGRMGYYGRIDWRPPAPIAINLIYLYNPGNPTIVENGQYGWTTRLLGGGLEAQLSSKDQVLSQSLWGSTKMGGIVIANRHAVDIQFHSLYVMETHSFLTGDKLSVRADYFDVIDQSWVASDNNNEKGCSATVAWWKPLSPHLDLVTEAVQVSSRRPSRITQGEAAAQSQTQVQLALRAHF